MSSFPAEGVLRGDRRALSKLITIIECGGPAARDALRRVYPHAGKAHIVGVTGSPGAGKSTLVNALAKEYRRRSKEVGIVAVDPSSALTGGAFLGDRVRMKELASDPAIFLRSMAARGNPGGLAAATVDVVCALDAFGKDVVFVETVGAGQDEVEIAKAAHTVVVVGVPGLGDEIQVFKAGLLEIAAIYVVNKADKEGAPALVSELLTLISTGPAQDWSVPVIRTVATTGEGASELADAIEAHGRYLVTSDGWRDHELERAERRVLSAAEELLRGDLKDLLAEPRWKAMVGDVANQRVDPYSVAGRLLAELPAGVRRR